MGWVYVFAGLVSLILFFSYHSFDYGRHSAVKNFVAGDKPYCETVTLGKDKLTKCWKAVEVPAEDR